MDYRVVGPNRVEVLGNQGKVQGEDFPYKRYPLQFPRRPIELDSLADVSKPLQKLLNTGMGDRISGSGRKAVDKCWAGASNTGPISGGTNSAGCLGWFRGRNELFVRTKNALGAVVVGP
jgi:hypothetical protein